MAEFLSNYGPWILLGGIFVAMHMFGTGCGGHGGHQHGSRPKDDSTDGHPGHGGLAPTESEAPAIRRAGGCH